MLTMREDAIIKAFDKKVPYSEINNLSGLLLSGDETETGPEKGDATPEAQL
jgi:hypothetical protein